MKQSLEIQELKAAVEKKVGMNMCTPHTFRQLSQIIFSENGEMLSESTLKRLWGYVNSETAQSHTTLDIISRFLGYKNFMEFRVDLDLQQTSVFANGVLCHSSELLPGDMVQIAWTPDRKCTFLYSGDNRYEVVEAYNSKLKKGNTFSAYSFMLDAPLYIHDLKQNKTHHKTFVAGARGGLTELKINRHGK